METSQGVTTPATSAAAVPFSFSEIDAPTPLKIVPETPVPDPEPPAVPAEAPEEPEPLAAKPTKEDLIKDLKDLKKSADKKDSKEPQKEAKPARTFKVTHGDQTIDVVPDSKLSVKVDGKEESVSFQQLVDNYSGKTNWSRKFQELSEEKKSLQETVNNLYDSFVAKGDALTGIEILVDALGGNPIEVRQKVTETLLKQMDSLASLSPEEREVARLKDELSHRKRIEESQREKSQKAKQHQELKAKVTKVLETYGLTEEQLVQTYDELKGLNVTDEQIEANPELLGQYHQAKAKQLKERETETGVTQMLKDIEAEFDSEEEKAEATSKLKKALELYPDMTLTELKEHAIEAYGSRSAKNLARKLKKSAPVNTAKAPERVKEPVTFDDL